MTPTCVNCERPTPDGYACHDDARKLAQALTVAAGHAEDAEAVLARQTRYGAGGRRGNDEPLPVDLSAAERYRAAENTIGTWARDLAETTGEIIPAPTWRQLNTTALAARFLAAHVELIRTWTVAREAFKELHDACRQLERLVDRPADKELVGMCDCGKVLYATRGRTVVQCRERTCGATWNVAQSREILGKALRGKLFTASEAARLAAFWNERTQPQIRALITTWTRPGRERLQARGWIPNDDYTGAEDDDQPPGWATYLLGDVLDLLAQTPRRKRQGVAA